MPFEPKQEVHYLGSPYVYIRFTHSYDHPDDHQKALGKFVPPILAFSY